MLTYIFWFSQQLLTALLKPLSLNYHCARYCYHIFNVSTWRKGNEVGQRPPVAPGKHAYTNLDASSISHIITNAIKTRYLRERVWKQQLPLGFVLCRWRKQRLLGAGDDWRHAAGWFWYRTAAGAAPIISSPLGFSDSLTGAAEQPVRVSGGKHGSAQLQLQPSYIHAQTWRLCPRRQRESHVFIFRDSVPSP